MTDLSGIQSALAGAAHNLVDSLLGDLLSFGPNQHTRLLRLHSPLGGDVLLAERAQITEGIGPRQTQPACAIDLLALSTKVDLQPTDLIGQPVLLELLTAHSTTQLRPFHGHVLAFELLGSDGGYARYRLQIGTWLDFLRHRTDAWIFQDQSVIDITEHIFADYAAQGTLQPTWRWDLKDAAVYPKLSTLSQHAETDFDFLQRLWAANGLFCWFEHTGDATDTGTLGSHTLVLADHNGAFTANEQSRIRFTQPGAVMKEDSITRWHGIRRVGTSTLHTASFDYRSVSNHAGSADVDAGHDQPMPLVHADQPGAYAFETPEEAQRLATVYLQSLEARRKQFEGRATVRTLAPATTFTLADHSEHDLDMLNLGGDASQFVVLNVVHRARNNMSADAKAGLQQLLGDASHLLGGEHAPGQGLGTADNASAEPLYEARFEAQRAAIPVRPALTDDQGALLHPKPTAWGTQTALVVGLDGPIHTDRDGRIKVQFHWQRGAGSSHRLDHAAGCNAPASDASGTWVRVAQDWAGANWGGVFTPRLGQEVVIAFVEGDIDRPVVIGASYNGQGSDNAQGNVVAGGAANATGNAPAWFPGSARQGEQEGHAHNATLSGFKSQSLDASQAGGGAYNQLVLDDTPGQGRVLAHTTQSQTWLQIGHLLQQNDNQRLAQRGHGLELHTQAWGAVRAGSGLHVSTHARRGGTSSTQGQPTDTREAQSQMQSHAELVKALSENAQTHLAKLPNEATPDKLPVLLAMRATVTALKGRESSEGESNSESGNASEEGGNVIAIDGGHGSIPTLARPDLVLSAAADISSATPAHSVINAGQNTTVTTGQDTNLLSQRHTAWAVKDGISLFTRGEAKDGQRAVQDVGMKLHAASGNVNVQAQSDAFMLTASQAVDIQSTAASITISAPEKILLNGGGGYIKIEGGNIEIGTSGNASFLASMKELTSGSSASAQQPSLKQAQGLFNEAFVVTDEDTGQVMRYVRYRIENAQGHVLAQGMTDDQGQTARVHTSKQEQIKLFLLD
ncbi:MAG TPA: type VI secretion system Vgr family protein [Aquabacterium sp.]|uniref:type VI secretion system Vgr family protein n=1 Tax=Aquabacterium sp. TaxID=1872578 RepID=UPI002E30E14B|nr:type VI secretion system Vgr family protein [Aquabacterium sp.]HEX5355141.1 type VI secretion system Vgr family protein [Aquabacterium sp.]